MRRFLPRRARERLPSRQEGLVAVKNWPEAKHVTFGEVCVRDVRSCGHAGASTLVRKEKVCLLFISKNNSRVGVVFHQMAEFPGNTFWIIICIIRKPWGQVPPNFNFVFPAVPALFNCCLVQYPRFDGTVSR